MEVRLDDPSATVPPAPSESAPERYRRISRGLMATDAACIAAALLIGYYLRYDNRPMPTEESLTVVFAPLLWLAAFQAFGLYAPQHLSPPEEFRRTFGAASVGIVLLVVASYWSHSDFSRLWMGATWVLALLLELLTRRGWRRHQVRLKGSGRLAFRTLIVGTSAEAGRLAHVLDNPASGFRPLGYVQGSDKTVSANTLPLLGDLEQLQSLIRDHDANCLFVASSALTFEDVSWVAQAARKEGVEVRISANLPQMLTSRLCFQTVGSTVAISLRPVRLTGRQVLLKRGFDLVVASIALVLATPLFAAIALAVKLTSRGPVFFRQARVTKDGKVFQMHKFRTMRTGADRAMDTSAPFFKVAADSRLTPVGRLIRLVAQGPARDRTPWLGFRTVTNDRWHQGNVVLLGDAAHTTHFTIGSGTKLAIEDAIGLAAALGGHRDLATALTAYERQRKTALVLLQQEARNSARWFENLPRYVALGEPRFAALLHHRRSPLLTRMSPAGYYRLRRMTELLPLFDRLWQWASGRGRARSVRRAPTT